MYNVTKSNLIKSSINLIVLNKCGVYLLRMNIKMNSLENMAFLVRSKIHNSKPWFNAIDTSPDSFSKIKIKPTLRKNNEYGL